MKREITLEEVLELRKEIPLCSIYYADYRNSLGVEEHDCCDFFDGYADFIEELMEEDGLDDEHYFDNLWMYDNTETLTEWFYCFDYCPLWVEEEEEEEEEEIE